MNPLDFYDGLKVGALTMFVITMTILIIAEYRYNKKDKENK